MHSSASSAVHWTNGDKMLASHAYRSCAAGNVRWWPRGCRGSAEREVAILRALPQAPGLVRFLGSCTVASGGPSSTGPGIEIFVLLALCRGGNLLDKLRTGDELTEGEVWKCLHDCATALAAVHAAGVAHFDLKLENILLSEECTGTATIADFGSAARLQVRCHSRAQHISAERCLLRRCRGLVATDSLSTPRRRRLSRSNPNDAGSRLIPHPRTARRK